MTLKSLKNIGQEIQKKLQSIGIHNPDDLYALGSKKAYAKLKQHYPEVCLVHLYALQAAVDDLELSQLSETVKKDLKQFSDSLK